MSGRAQKYGRLDICGTGDRACADSAGRQAAMDRLLPMQRQDFIELFEIMSGLPVTIRLLDPPLHEFLPSDREGMHDLAEALGLPLSDVVRRVETMGEYNPMLGMRGGTVRRYSARNLRNASQSNF